MREIEVVPNGREQSVVFNGRLETAVDHTVSFPAPAIADASKIFVRLYPGPLSQVIEGMDSILRMPGGCFEQTSSSTYPNVLALDYMKRTKKLTPEVHAKAEGYIANGYQRLLTFEVPGGGFSWFGQAPANKILTSYGLMEFADMAQGLRRGRPPDRAHPAVAGRAAAGRRKLEARHRQFINEGATNRYNSDVLRITAYIAWSLENTGYQGPAVEKARQFVEQHMSGDADAYTLAVLANFAVDYAQGPRIHRPGDAASAGRAHREGRPSLVDAPKRPASMRAARAPAWRPPAWPCRRCSNGARHRPRRARRCTISPRRRTPPAPGAPRRPPSWRCGRCCSRPRKAPPMCAARWRFRSTASRCRNSR